MIQTAGRLTLYGLIASIDVDLRRLVRDEILTQLSAEDAFPADVFEKLSQRALKDDQPDGSALVDYLDLGDSLSTLRRHASILPNSLARLIRRHGENFDKLIPVRNRVMHARPILLSDYPIADSISKLIRDFPAAYFQSTRDFDDRVRRDPHHVFSIDVSGISRESDRIPNNLPLPDYDETGFVGRDQEQEELKRLCRSQWPVITVVGEGGYGKTALALQVAYDILDDEEFEFDAIVWTTAKRIKLTLSDIENIDDAITSSIGILSAAASELSGSEKTADPLSEVVNYLNTFKILLIIDNLETILDPLLVKFLRQLNGHSKVLTTSRVGVGELSYSFPLSQMKLNEAVRLLRTLAKVRKVEDLAKAKNSVLDIYCKKMKLNAGFIKWFVTSVQYGKRPDEVLANPKVFLDFCVSYVFSHVSDDAKLVTRAMLAAPGKQSLPLISYLTDLSGDRLELALSSLQSANILRMSTSFDEDASETVYELSELPRLYILKNHPPAPKEDAEFKRRKREVVALYDRLQGEGGAYKYSSKTIACRTPSDSVLARLLVSALDLTRQYQPELAMEKVKQAISLDPSFSESYRVEAYLHYVANNYIAAEDAFQAALELDPKSSPLRFWYGLFQLRAIRDAKEAFAQFEAARAIDPENPRIQLEAARCALYLGEFEDAHRRTASIIERSDLPLTTARYTLVLFLQTAAGWGQRLLADGRLSDGLEMLSATVHRICECPTPWFDDHARRSVGDVETTILRVARCVGGDDALEKGQRLASVLRQCSMIANHEHSHVSSNSDEFPQRTSREWVNELPDSSERLTGRIRRVFYDKKYGFIATRTGDIFFHFTQTGSPEYIAVGAEVSFKIKPSGDGRLTATSINIDKPAPIIDTDQTLSGQISNLTRNYGFIFGEDGHDYFFHASNMKSGDFLELQNGTNVLFTTGRSEKGLVALNVEVQDD